MMSQKSLLVTSGVDPFLQQASLFLQDYWNTMRDITNKDLHLITREFTPMPPGPFQSLHIQIAIPVVYVPAQERKVTLDVVPVTGRRLKGSGYTVKSTLEALYLAELVTAYNKNLLRVVTQEMQALQSLQVQFFQFFFCKSN